MGSFTDSNTSSASVNTNVTTYCWNCNCWPCSCGTVRVCNCWPCSYTRRLYTTSVPQDIDMTEQEAAEFRLAAQKHTRIRKWLDKNKHRIRVLFDFD